MVPMTAPIRTDATNAISGVSSRANAAAITAWYGPVTTTFVHGHKYPRRRPPL